MRMDASKNRDGDGAVLIQDYDRKNTLVYASRKLLDRDQRNSVEEKECHAIVRAFQKCQSYLYRR